MPKNSQIKLIKNHGQGQTRSKIRDHQEFDIDEIDDRIQVLKDQITDLEDSRDSIVQYKMNVSTFFQLRGKILKDIQRHKRQFFKDKLIFQRLNNQEQDVQNQVNHAQSITEELESEGQEGLIEFFQEELSKFDVKNNDKITQKLHGKNEGQNNQEKSQSKSPIKKREGVTPTKKDFSIKRLDDDLKNLQNMINSIQLNTQQSKSTQNAKLTKKISFKIGGNQVQNKFTMNFSKLNKDHQQIQNQKIIKPQRSSNNVHLGIDKNKFLNLSKSRNGNISNSNTGETAISSNLHQLTFDKPQTRCETTRSPRDFIDQNGNHMINGEISFEFSDSNTSQLQITSQNKQFKQESISNLINQINDDQDDNSNQISNSFGNTLRLDHLSDPSKELDISDLHPKNISKISSHKSSSLKMIDKKCDQYQQKKQRIKLQRKLKEEEERFNKQQERDIKEHLDQSRRGCQDIKIMRSCENYCSIF
eukprot:403375618